MNIHNIFTKCKQTCKTTICKHPCLLAQFEGWMKFYSVSILLRITGKPWKEILHQFHSDQPSTMQKHGHCHTEARVICFNSETTLGLFGVMNTRSVPEAREREQPRKQARRTCEIKLVNTDQHLLPILECFLRVTERFCI